MEPSKEAIQAALDGLNHTGDPIGQALRSAYSIDFAELHSDILILLAELQRFLETRQPDTTLGVTLHASLKKVLREKVKRMTERLQIEIL